MRTIGVRFTGFTCSTARASLGDQAEALRINGDEPLQARVVPEGVVVALPKVNGKGVTSNT